MSKKANSLCVFNLSFDVGLSVQIMEAGFMDRLRGGGSSSGDSTDLEKMRMEIFNLRNDVEMCKDNINFINTHGTKNPAKVVVDLHKQVKIMYTHLDELIGSVKSLARRTGLLEIAAGNRT